MKNIVIAGYYGFGNLGDELILSSLIKDLLHEDCDLNILVLSNNIEQTKTDHNVKSVNFRNINDVVFALTEADLVIIGGGGIFHDYWGIQSEEILTERHQGITYYLGISLISAILNKKQMLYSVGIGPLLSDLGKKYTRIIANLSAVITVRDNFSKNLLVAIGVNDEKITVTADLVFGFISPAISKRKLNQIGEKITLGICLRDWVINIQNDHWKTEISRFLNLFLAHNPNTNIVFIPFQDSDEKLLSDYHISIQVKSKLHPLDRVSILPENLPIASKLQQFSNCDIILGMRLHSIILALVYGIPVAGIIYDKKVLGATQDLLSQDRLFPLDAVNADSMLCVFESMILNLREENIAAVEIKNVIKKERYSSKLALELLNKPLKQSQLSEELNELIGSLLINHSLKLDLFDNSRVNQFIHSKKFIVNGKMTEITDEYESINPIKTIPAINKIFDHIQDLELQNNDLISSINTLEKKVNNQNQIIDEITSEINESQKELQDSINNHHVQIDSLITELKSIKSSRAWKLILLIWKIRLHLFPKNSKIGKFIFAKDIQNDIPKIFKKKIFNSFSFLLSLNAISFLTYKRNRKEIVGEKLNSLRTTGIKGLVSIILPVFNGEKYIDDCISSILNQSYPSFEVIIINDGSTDKTEEIISRYSHKDVRIKYFNQGNLNLPHALNTGFSLSHGEFLTWISHDNRLKPTFLEEMVLSLADHPGWDFIYADMDIIDEKGNPLLNSPWYAGYQKPFGSNHINLPKLPLELNTYPNNFIGGAFLYRSRVAILVGNYSTNQFTREDYDYWMRINLLLSIRHVHFKKPLYEYRFHHESLTARDKDLGITSNRDFLMLYDEFRRDYSLSPAVWIIENLYETNNKIITRLVKLLSSKNQILFPSENLSQIPINWIPLIRIFINPNFENENLLINHINFSCILNVFFCTEELPSSILNKNSFDLFVILTGSENLLPDYPNVIISNNLSQIITAIDVKSRSKLLEKIENDIFFPKPYQLRFSVIICTYNRDLFDLQKTILSVLDQSVSLKEYEILIIDNNQENKIPRDFFEIFDSFITQNKNPLRCIDCPISGLSISRNVGMAESKGDILIFLDDDAIASFNLLEEYQNAYNANSNIGVIGGHIRLLLPDELTLKWNENWGKYWSEFISSKSELFLVDQWWNFPWGANWSARHQVLLSIGGFRNKFGRRKNDFGGGEEIIASTLIQKIGYSIGILPGAEIIHNVKPSRFTLKHLRRTIFSGLLTQYQAKRENYYSSNKSEDSGSLKSVIPILYNNIKAGSKHNSSLLESTYIFEAHVKITFLHLVDVIKRIKFFRV